MRELVFLNRATMSFVGIVTLSEIISPSLFRNPKPFNLREFDLVWLVGFRCIYL